MNYIIFNTNTLTIECYNAKEVYNNFLILIFREYIFLKNISPESKYKKVLC